MAKEKRTKPALVAKGRGHPGLPADAAEGLAAASLASGFPIPAQARAALSAKRCAELEAEHEARLEAARKAKPAPVEEPDEDEADDVADEAAGGAQPQTEG